MSNTRRRTTFNCRWGNVLRGWTEWDAALFGGALRLNHEVTKTTKCNSS